MNLQIQITDEDLGELKRALTVSRNEFIAVRDDAVMPERARRIFRARRALGLSVKPDDIIDETL